MQLFYDNQLLAVILNTLLTYAYIPRLHQWEEGTSPSGQLLSARTTNAIINKKTGSNITTDITKEAECLHKCCANLKDNHFQNTEKCHESSEKSRWEITSNRLSFRYSRLRIINHNFVVIYTLKQSTDDDDDGQTTRSRVLLSYDRHLRKRNNHNIRYHRWANVYVQNNWKTMNKKM